MKEVEAAGENDMHIILFMIFVVSVSLAHDLMGNPGIIIFIGILIYLIFGGKHGEK